MKKQKYLPIIITVVIVAIFAILVTVLNPSAKPPVSDIPDTPTTTSTSSEVVKPTAEDTTSLGTVKDYITYKDNTVYAYVSQGDESKISDLYNQEIAIMYRDGDTFQRKIIVPGFIYEYDEIINVTEDKATLIFGQNTYNHENLIGNPPAIDDFVILQGPIKKGNKWNVNPTSVSEITDIAAQVEVPYGKFTAIEVSTNKSNGDFVKDYYVKGVGLVKTVFSSAKAGEQISSLDNIKENTPLPAYITKIYYDAVSDKVVDPVREPIEIPSYPDYKQILEDSLKIVSNTNYVAIISKNTKINSVEISKDYSNVTVDLSKEYLSDMNAGSDVELSLIKSFVDTVGGYYGTETVTMLIDGKTAEDGAASFGEPMTVEKPKDVTENAN